jgi:1-deoxy-D-xylulose-5-phosphate reductoisomerase
MSFPRGVALLGATGSIGHSTLNVLRRHSDRYRVVSLTAGRRANVLDRLALGCDPDFVVLADRPAEDFEPRWPGEWRFGREAMLAAATDGAAPIVVNGLVGFAGLESILQCIRERPASEVSRIILTASGGPFRGMPAHRFSEIRPEDALAHPTWSMGDKITVDSATLANKALEVIEAHLLFGVDFERIEVVVHPPSIVHSLVEFRDGSTVAQLGHPTMEVPIQYALSAPERLDNEFRPFDPVASSPLEFEALRTDDFPMFELGVDAGRTGGTAPAVYNAANEVAVRAFLDRRISFPHIPILVERTLGQVGVCPVESVEHLVAVDGEARSRAEEGAGTPVVARGETHP